MLFKDKNGNKYCLSINIGNARKVKKAFEVDLLDVQQTLEKISMAENDEQKRRENIELLFEICFMLAESNSDSRSLDEDTFYEGLNGEAIYDLSNAFLEALEDFTPSPAMRKILSRCRAMIAKTEAEQIKKVESLDFSEIVKDGA